MDIQKGAFHRPSKNRVQTFRPPKNRKLRFHFLKRAPGVFLEKALFVRSLLKLPRLKTTRWLSSRRVLYPLLAGSLGLLGLGLLPSLFLEPKGQKRPSIKQIPPLTGPMVELARAMNLHAPFLVNKETLLEKAFVGENGLVVRYRLVGRAKEDMDVENFLNKARAFVLARACFEPKALEVLKSGEAIVYAFFDKKGVALGEVPLAWPDCSNLKVP